MFKIYHIDDNYFSRPCISLDKLFKDDHLYDGHYFKRTQIYVPSDIWIGMKS